MPNDDSREWKTASAESTVDSWEAVARFPEAFDRPFHPVFADPGSIDRLTVAEGRRCLAVDGVTPVKDAPSRTINRSPEPIDASGEPIDPTRPGSDRGGSGEFDRAGSVERSGRSDERRPSLEDRWPATGFPSRPAEFASRASVFASALAPDPSRWAVFASG